MKTKMTRAALVAIFAAILFCLTIPGSYLAGENSEEGIGNLEKISDAQRAEIEKLIDSRIEKFFDVKLSGELWLYWYSPLNINDVNYDDEFNLDYLWLKIAKETDNFGFHAWYNIRDERRFGSYAFGKNFLYDAFVYAKTPVGKLQFGKFRTDFGLEWDHTWYGSLLYLKGFMCEPDWGSMLQNNLSLDQKTKLTYSIGYFNRSDGIDGASTIEAFDIPEFNSPEFGVNTPGSSDGDRRQENAVNLRLNTEHTFNNDTSASLGFSFYKGDIEYAALDVREDEINLEVDCVFKHKSFQFLAEAVFYDRGDVKDINIPFDDFNKGKTILGEIYLEFYRNENNPWCKSLATWFNYSIDRPDEGRESNLMIFALGGNLSDDFRWMLEYVDWKMKKFKTLQKAEIDKGFYLGLGYSF